MRRYRIKGLVQALDDFCDNAQMDKNTRQAYRQQVHSYCSEQLQSGEEIELKELSKELPMVEEQSFEDFTRQNDYQLEESFPADRGTLKQLTKFSGSGGGLRLALMRC